MIRFVLKKHFHKNIHISLFNKYFYKNKQSKLCFGDRVAKRHLFPTWREYVYNSVFSSYSRVLCALYKSRYLFLLCRAKDPGSPPNMLIELLGSHRQASKQLYSLPSLPSHQSICTLRTSQHGFVSGLGSLPTVCPLCCVVTPCHSHAAMPRPYSHVTA